MDSPDSAEWRDLLGLSGEIAPSAIGAALMDSGEVDRCGDGNDGSGQHAVVHGRLGTKEMSTVAKSDSSRGQFSNLAEPPAAAAAEPRDC